jgi:hypothetical protein
MKRHPLMPIAALAAMLAAGSAHAQQATRTWVSGVGDDANPCSRTAPCRTFAGALVKTVPGGEIDALDPGEFGIVTITKAITIDGGGALASILASGTNGVFVNAQPTARIVLRNLSINGIADTTAIKGLRGIHFAGGGGLHVDHCVIEGFTMAGIVVEAAAAVYVSDTAIRRAAGGGVDLAPASGVLQATLDGVRVEASGFGVRAGPNATVVVRSSSAASNGGDGFLAAGAAQMTILRSLTAHNLRGVHALGGATIRISGSAILNNTGEGLLAEEGSRVLSFKDNDIAGNAADGKPSKKLTKK